MGFVVAKESPNTPEGWTYFKDYEEIDNYKYPMNTIIADHAYQFDTKEDAAKAYWAISQYFYGYKIYELQSIRGKNYVT
jgi:hypothetical protein